MMVVDAKLVFDSAKTGGLMGARSLVGGDRSLLFSAGPMVVDLVVYQGADDMRVVHGQVVGRADEEPVVGASVRLGGMSETVATDEFGQFTLSTMLPFDQTILSIVAEGADEVRCSIPTTGENAGAAP